MNETKTKGKYEKAAEEQCAKYVLNSAMSGHSGTAFYRQLMILNRACGGRVMRPTAAYGLAVLQ